MTKVGGGDALQLHIPDTHKPEDKLSVAVID